MIESPSKLCYLHMDSWPNQALHFGNCIFKPHPMSSCSSNSCFQVYKKEKKIADHPPPPIFSWVVRIAHHLLHTARTHCHAGWKHDFKGVCTTGCDKLDVGKLCAIRFTTPSPMQSLLWNKITGECKLYITLILNRKFTWKGTSQKQPSSKS